MISIPSLFLIAGSGLFAGFLTGLISLGGAFIVVPAIYHALLSLGHDSHSAFTTAVATSLAFVLISSTSAASTYAKNRLIDYRLVTLVSAGAVAGLVLGINTLLNSDDAVIRLAFGIFIWVLGSYMLIARYLKLGRANEGRTASYTPANQAGVFVVGSVVGFLVGAFGIGGGGIIAPAVALLTRSDMKRAVATGVGATVVISAIGSAGYVVSGVGNEGTVFPSMGWVYLPAILLLIPSALVAAPVGAKLAIRLSQTTLTSFLAVSMFLIGLKFIVSS